MYIYIYEDTEEEEKGERKVVVVGRVWATITRPSDLRVHRRPLRVVNIVFPLEYFPLFFYVIFFILLAAKCWRSRETTREENLHFEGGGE